MAATAWIVSRIRRIVERGASISEKEKEGVPDDIKQQVFVLTYPQDEAYRVLSLFGQHALICTPVVLHCSPVGISRNVAPSGGMKLSGSSSGSVFRVLMIVPFVFMSLSYTIFAVADVLGCGNSFVALFGTMGKSIQAGLQDVLETVFWWGIRYSYLSGLFLLLVCTSMFLVGAIRYGLFRLAGLVEVTDVAAAWIDSLLGGVIVTAAPEGRAEIEQIPGTRGFNHSKIYDDPKAISIVPR